MQELPPSTHFDRILFLTDLKRRSDAALSYARAFARYFDSRLILLHVLPSEPMQESASLSRSFSNEQRQRLDSLAAEMVAAGFNAETHFERGEPVDDVLNDAIKQLRPDLIIQGSAGVDDARRLIVGSVAESVFRTSVAPVLTVGPHVPLYMRRPLEFGKILFLTDFGTRAKTTALYALSLAQEFRARVRLCHVQEGLTKPWDREQVRQFVKEELQGFVGSEALDWCDPECSVAFGDAVPKIQAIAEQETPDLIVLGAHRLGQLGTHGEPGVAFKVMAQAKCPVLTLAGEKGAPHKLLRTDNRPDLVPLC